jgi:hypothetical protein
MVQTGRCRCSEGDTMFGADMPPSASRCRGSSAHGHVPAGPERGAAMLLPLLSDQVRCRGYGVRADASPFLLSG